MRKSLPVIATWKDVATLLRATLAPTVSSTTKLARWIEQLRKVPDGEILGVCLAIDLASKSLSGNLIGKIIDILDVSRANQRLQFQLAVDNHPDSRNLVCASMIFGPPLGNPDSYARILSVEAFITHFVGPSMPAYLPLSALSKRQVKRRFLNSRGGNLGTIDRWWSGRRGVTWVLSASALRALAPKNRLRDSASVVNDALGLGHPISTELMMVVYPKGIDNFIQLKAPTVLDNDWEHPGGFFISLGGANGWGLTQSCSGEYPGIPERVHGGIKNPSDKFKTLPLGEVAKFSTDRDRLIKEAYRRLTSIIDSSAQGKT